MAAGVLAVVVVVLMCGQLVENKAVGRCFDRVQEVPGNKVGLVLGTSARVVGGGSNPFFENRMKAASELFFAGKVEYLVVSGDNRHTSYNEPRDMKKALVALGIPPERIILDFAGLRTLDSVVRMKTVFGQSEYTVVSQRFQNERAIYIASKHGINAVGFNAEDVEHHFGFATYVREYFARVKVFIDILTDREPHFAGEPIKIPE